MKTLALAQHLGLEVFEFDGEYYTGATQEEFDKSFEENVDIHNGDDIVAFLEGYTKLEDELVQSSHDDSRIEYGNEEYLVCTDSEADDEWDAYMDSYIDDCVLCELPENYKMYFDSEKFKKDCSYDGRGHSLASYDGNENEETFEGETYYIYRTN